ncbi:hypothetical protein F8M41_018871 [Gigaspora margarita]|uniref:Uncharacterized protein n=1 Tax=Gigaspora margarita TaxID=4874 RepID=A0A8H4AKZ2_GIGMA|nr:hypothetical protein F8M41_018871 [Gigaspora margarita]
MIMWSIISGRPPSTLNEPKNIFEIPIKVIPQAYFDLYSKCLIQNSKERPSAHDVHTQLIQIKIALRESQITDEQNINVSIEQDTTITIAQNDNELPGIL